MDRPVLETYSDRYVIVSHIAEGGMGAIFLGKRVGIGGFEKEVVLKQLLPEFTSQSEFIDLFLREARLSAALDHANIVHTIDLVSAGSNYFIVMEFVDGGDLRSIGRRIKRRGHRLDPAAALFIGREVLAALTYAHEKKDNDGRALKLIHRDISPSNVMVSSAGQVKLTDFGIAKAATHKSVFYRVKGKVGYMSPEQAWGRPLDHRSDLYSLAVVLYELLAGERLFVADLMSVPEQIYSQPVEAIENDEHPVPVGLDAVMQRALALDPDDRYQSAPEFLDALVKVALDNAILFNSADLASHLREVCGDDPSTWNQEDPGEEGDRDDGPGTMMIAGEEHEYSGVELTSLIPAEIAESLASGPLTEALELPEHEESTASDLSEVAQPSCREAAADPSPRASDARAPDLRMGEDWPESDETDDDFWAGQETIALPSRQLPSSPSTPRRPPAADQHYEPPVVVDPMAHPEPSRPPPGPPPAPVAPAVSTPAPHIAPTRKGSVPGHRRQTAPRKPPERPRPFNIRPARPRALDLGLASAGQATRRRRRVAIWVAAWLLIGAAAGIFAVIALTGDDDVDVPIAVVTDAAVEAAIDSAPDAAPTPPDRGAPAVMRDAKPPALDAPPSTGVRLTVESSPGKAFVYLDGVRQCRATCTVRDLDPSHVYVLSVRKRTYVSWSRLVDPRRGKRIATKAYLSEEPDSRKVGYLVIRSRTKADVAVDGTKIGHVTGEGRIPLTAGQHEITLSHPRKRKRLRFLVTIYRQRITTTEMMKF